MKTFIIAGLGNPGEKYKNTRHNIGFILIDYLASELLSYNKFHIWKGQVEYISGEFGGNKIYLLKPLLYMNLSGVPLKGFLNFHNLDIKNLVICFDDVSIEFGKIKIRKKGSDGGHNGLKSVINVFGTENIKRIRIGIGPKKENIDLADFVLSEFSAKEKENLPSIIEKCKNAIIEIVENDIDIAMNKFNL